LILQTFGPGAAALGGLALAAILFGLQRLRVRHREQTVITNLFWREAVEEARARVLVERFRHPLAYLLLLTIGLAIWFAAAGPRTAERGERDQVLLLDGSAGMARAGRFEAALEALRQAAADAPRDATTVLWCGAEVRTLLLPGEDPRHLDGRLQGLAPEAAPASIERALLALTSRRDPERGLALRVAGDAPVDEDLLELLPDDVDVARLPSGSLSEDPNAGVVALGVAPAASGAWDRVDVLVELAGPESMTSAFVGAVDGRPVSSKREGDLLRFADLDADGSLFSLQLTGFDALAFDDVVEFVLPNRPRLRVMLGTTLPAPLVDALGADPAVVVVDAGESADLVVRRAGEDLGAGLPALELVSPADQAQAFLITSPEDDPEVALVRGMLELGLDRIDATALAETAGVVISVGARTGATRGLTVWEELLGPGYDLVQGRAFPLVIGQTVRWLGAVEPYPSVVAAGLPLELAIEGLEPLGTDSVPPTAGSYTRANGEALRASLLSPGATAGLGNGLEPSEADRGSGLDPVLLLALLALGLLLVEGALYRTGRMP
jgi:hypothetical protein